MLYVVASVAVCVRSSGERTNEYPAMGGITVHIVGSMTFVAKGLITHTHSHVLCIIAHTYINNAIYLVF